MIIFALAVNSSWWLRLLNTLLDVDVLKEPICSGIAAGVIARGAQRGGAPLVKILALPLFFIVY